MDRTLYLSEKVEKISRIVNIILKKKQKSHLDIFCIERKKLHINSSKKKI